MTHRPNPVLQILRPLRLRTLAVAAVIAALSLIAIRSDGNTPRPAPTAAGTPIVGLAQANLEDTGLLPVQPAAHATPRGDVYMNTLDFPRLTT